MTLIMRFLNDRQGATAIEYGLIAGLIALGCVTGFGQASAAIDFLFGSNDSRFRQAIN